MSEITPDTGIVSRECVEEPEMTRPSKGEHPEDEGQSTLTIRVECCDASSSGESCIGTVEGGDGYNDDDDDDREDVDAGTWLDFGSWLKVIQEDDEEMEDDDDITPRNGPESATPTDGMKRHGPMIMQKDCRMQHSRLGPGHGQQEISVMLGAPGISPDKNPVVPTKAIGSVINLLNEPLVKVEVGVLTRTMNAPTSLVPRTYAGRGTLALYILPDDSLSLVYSGSIRNDKDISEAGASRLEMVQTSLTYAETIECAGMQTCMLEEIARFPRWREGMDPIVTLHMLKGDKSGRSFYVLPSKGTEPPEFPLSEENQEKFGSFTQGDISEKTAADRRHYFWLTGLNLEDEHQALGKMKSYIKRPPGFAKTAGISEELLQQLQDWFAMVREQSGSEYASSAMAFMGPILGSQAPSMSIKTAFTHNGTQIQSVLHMASNASALFKDPRFNIACPCRITVYSDLIIQGKIRNPGDHDDIALREIAVSASHEGRCVSEILSRRAVEAIGKPRVEELICEDLIFKAKKQRQKIKAARQKKREIERGRLALLQATPLIKRAVAGLERTNPSSIGNDCPKEESISPRSSENFSDVERVVLGPTTDEPAPPTHDATCRHGGTGKITVSDLRDIFSSK